MKTKKNLKLKNKEKLSGIKKEKSHEKKDSSLLPLLDPKLQTIIKGLGYDTLTDVQKKMFPELLTNKSDIICSSAKGSGKMLSFLLPIIQKIMTDEEEKRYIIISGTKERLNDIYSLSKELLQDLNGNKIAVLTGGANSKKEFVKLLNKKIRLIISSPQRIIELIQKDKNNELVLSKNISTIIFDELEIIEKNNLFSELSDIIELYGFNEDTDDDEKKKELINKNINFVFYFEHYEEYKNNYNINELISKSKRDYKTVLINNSQKKEEEGGIIEKKIGYGITKRGYIVLNPSKKFLFLLTFLRKNTQKKVIIIFSTYQEIIFYNKLLNLFHINSTILESNSTRNIKSNSNIITEYNKQKNGVLLCTDIFKFKLKPPLTDWIIFFDSPPDIRTFDKNLEIWNGEGSSDKITCFMILMPHEIGLLKEKADYEIAEFTFNVGRVLKDQEKVENYVNKKEHSVLVGAYEAYRAFLFHYITRKNKEVFDYDKIDLTELCKAFGFEHPPFVNLSTAVSLESLEDNTLKKTYLFPEEIESIYNKK